MPAHVIARKVRSMTNKPWYRTIPGIVIRIKYKKRGMIGIPLSTKMKRNALLTFNHLGRIVEVCTENAYQIDARGDDRPVKSLCGFPMNDPIVQDDFSVHIN